MRELSLFSGGGGGLLASHLLGWTTRGYVEWDPYCQRLLAARMLDGYLPTAPIFGDIRTFVGEGYAAEYQGMVDVVSGGFPCQPFSLAGKRAGEDDARNMWPATLDVLRAVRPRFAFLENVPGLLTSGYFGTVLRGLAEEGFDAVWCVLGAGDVGAPHRRDRLWILANATHRRPGRREQQQASSEGERGLANSFGEGLEERQGIGSNGGEEREATERGGAPLSDPASVGRGEWRAEPEVWRRVTGTGGDGSSAALADPNSERPREARRLRSGEEERTAGGSENWWRRDPADGGDPAQPVLGRVADGVADRVDRLRALGNGQVPTVAVTAWKLLWQAMTNEKGGTP